MAEHSCGTLKNRARVTVPCLLPEPFPISYFNEFDFPSGVSAPPLFVPHRRGKRCFSVRSEAPEPHFLPDGTLRKPAFWRQDLCIFYAQFLHLRKLFYAHFIKGRFGCFVKSDFFPMRLQKLFAVTNLAVLLIS